MIRGMTGKASLRFSNDTMDVEMEIRSVNSRYFEFRIKTPQRYGFLEIEARKIVSKTLERGKIDLSIRVNEKSAPNEGAMFNAVLAKAYLDESRALAANLGINSDISLSTLINLPQVLNSDTSEVSESVIKLFNSKIEELVKSMLPMMLEEGDATKKDVDNSLEIMTESMEFIKDRYPAVLDKYKQSLIDRVKEISAAKAPEDRLAVEVELFASRTSINEELVRLESHIKIMKESIDGLRKDISSKELDFIAQEMNREVNTIASKSSDFSITEHTITLKREIEKMREQFRNIV